jgi:diacylglycerol kinase (ATP)
MRIAIILNPKSGTNRNKNRLLESISRICKEEFPDAFLWIKLTEYAGHASKLAMEIANQGFDVCIAAGGDGTMNEVARSLLGTKTALGIVPLGSGNGLARHLNLSLDPEKAFRQCISGVSISMDVGVANGHYFFLAAGIGFEGEVSHRFATKKNRGFLQYIYSSFEIFRKYAPIRIEGSIDGQKFNSEVFTLTIANGSQYGNGAIISPGSLVNDGLFQLVRVFPFPIWFSLRLFVGLMRGSLQNSDYYASVPCRNLVLRSEKPLPGHLDGEPVDFGNELNIEILDLALLVRIPS